MKLDKRLELITALSLLAFDRAEDESDEINLCSVIIEDFELKEESFPKVDNVTALLMLRSAIFEIQDMIEEYEGFEREEEVLH